MSRKCRRLSHSRLHPTVRTADARFALAVAEALEPRRLLNAVSFLPGPLLTAGTNPTVVKTGDVNGDSKMDLVVANRGSNNISVFLGNGDGTFQAQKLALQRNHRSTLVQ